MGILSKCPYSQLISDAEINAQAESARRKVVPSRVVISVDIDKVAETRQPDTPAVSRSGLQCLCHGFLEDWLSTLALPSGPVAAPLIFMLELNPVDPLAFTTVPPV
jgi:hypothetical protein